jgi:hypothetical protein
MVKSELPLAKYPFLRRERLTTEPEWPDKVLVHVPELTLHILTFVSAEALAKISFE